MGAASLLTTMAGCDLDVTMYDGVMAEDLNPRNLVEVSQGSYRLLKMTEDSSTMGSISGTTVPMMYHGEEPLLMEPLKYMTIPEASPTAVRNILGNLDTAPSAIAIWSLKCVRN